MDIKNIEILIVDDTPANLQLLASILKEEGYKIRPASSGRLALDSISKKLPDLILLDIRMPDMDGYEVCSRLKQNPLTKNIPVLFISALTDVNDKLKAFNVGGLDYINKPFQIEEVKARVSTHLQLKALQSSMEQKISEGIDEIQSLSREIIETQRELILTMGEICETRSHETGMHVKRVADYSFLLAQLYGCSDADLIKQASPMHDIGKVAIPDYILNKPGPLTEAEWVVMKTHSELGFHMLSVSQRPLLKMAAIIAQQHHEKWDGSGYPQALKADEIHIAGRISGFADVLDALGHERCYKKAWEWDRILQFIEVQRAKHFDPRLTDLFFEHIDQFVALAEQHRKLEHG
ncbi:response regulator [Methylomonas sp. LL1]|uniref:response regulator n=1 Tax=Methylomonas sp. LL1 TaxID=2785785 RepID=UPI0018C3ACF9|nr:response regulator [Methylomonas sp. LL1]QPK64365.1 response regulator [Methylomonas sp. LL1]